MVSSAKNLLLVKSVDQGPGKAWDGPVQYPKQHKLVNKTVFLTGLGIYHGTLYDEWLAIILGKRSERFANIIISA